MNSRPTEAVVSPQMNYRYASDNERIHSIYAGDPVGDYYGFESTQRQLLEDERYAPFGELLLSEAIEMEPVNA